MSVARKLSVLAALVLALAAPSAALSQQKLKFAPVYETSEPYHTAAKALNRPEDMKGLKIRVPDAPLYTLFPRAVGANPTPIAFAEVYLALQNGTVEAQENPLPTIDAKKFYEVQSHINLTAHITDSLLTIICAGLRAATFASPPPRPAR